MGWAALIDALVMQAVLLLQEPRREARGGGGGGESASEARTCLLAVTLDRWPWQKVMSNMEEPTGLAATMVMVTSCPGCRGGAFMSVAAVVPTSSPTGLYRLPSRLRGCDLSASFIHARANHTREPFLHSQCRLRSASDTCLQPSAWHRQTRDLEAHGVAGLERQEAGLVGKHGWQREDAYAAIHPRISSRTGAWPTAALPVPPCTTTHVRLP